MTPEAFVDQLQSSVVKQNIYFYERLLKSGSIDSVSDEYWRQSIILYRSLSGVDQAVLLKIMRQVAVDTLSNVLGILDGSTVVDGSRENFQLFSSSDSKLLNGSLQELFLEAEEKLAE